MQPQTAVIPSSGAKVETVRLFIDGQWQEATSGRSFQSLNPATGEVLAEVQEALEPDVDRAARAAKKAFDEGAWPRMAASERSRILNRIADLILSRKDELARLESLDSGKPIRESLNVDIPRSALNFQFFAGLINYENSECFPLDDRALSYVRRQPVGVAALITPWNLPLYLATWKVAPCLAAGNTCVLKPAELTPLTASKLGEIAAEAGLPDGVLNIVHGFGPASAGEFLTKHPAVRLISFTGETTTGRHIMAAAAPTLKRLSFELGGKGAVVMFADADLAQAIPVAFRAAFQNQGEVCLAGSRLFVEDKIFDTVVERIVGLAAKTKVGDPLDPATEMGALIGEEHWKKVNSYVELARSEGATIHCGGKRPDYLPRGNFFEPTVITGAPSSSRVCQEEIFGPVVTIIPFRSESEVVQMVNSTPYGLSAVVCSTNLDRAHRVAGQLDMGTVWINCWLLRDLRTPFGGMKSSGIGREGGHYSMEFFTDAKTVCVKL